MQILESPCLFMRDAEDVILRESPDTANREFLHPAVSRFFVESYLPPPQGERFYPHFLHLVRTERRVAPLLSGAHGLPPTSLVSAGIDRLALDNRLAFGALEAAHVPVVWRHFEHVPHGFMTQSHLPSAHAALSLVVRDLVGVLISDASNVPVEHSNPAQAAQVDMVQRGCALPSRGSRRDHAVAVS